MSQESPVVILYDENSKPLAVRNGVVIPADTPGLLPLAKAADGKSYYLEVMDDSGVKRLRVDSKISGGFTGQVEGRADNGATPVGFPVWVAGWDGTLVRAILTDKKGRVVVAPAGSISSLNGFSCGTVSFGGVGLYVVRSSTYTEQTTNAQRSIASSSANDTAAGTGVRSVKITYYDQTMDGPFTETVTMNGTSYVNTVATNICFIEKLEAVTVGSGGTNAGIITLKASTGGGGVTIWTIPAGDGQTHGAHHYVNKDRTCYITGLMGSVQAGTTDNGAYFLRALNPLVANSFDSYVSDFVRVYGQAAFLRSYGTPIKIPGPARIVLWVNYAGSNNKSGMGSFDFYEQVE